MNDAFGAHDTSSATAAVPDGSYVADVASAELVIRNGAPVIDSKSGKKKVKIVVAIADGPHSGATLPRTTNIAFGANTESGAYATFAQFIEAATGIKCGDPAQKNVGPKDLAGKRVGITVLENSKGYADIVRFKRIAQPAAEPIGNGVLGATAKEIIALAERLNLSTQMPRWFAKASNGRTDTMLRLTEAEGQVVLAALRQKHAQVAA